VLLKAVDVHMGQDLLWPDTGLSALDQSALPCLYGILCSLNAYMPSLCECPSWKQHDSPSKQFKIAAHTSTAMPITTHPSEASLNDGVPFTDVELDGGQVSRSKSLSA
jgi:hypothetical protein